MSAIVLPDGVGLEPITPHIGAILSNVFLSGSPEPAQIDAVTAVLTNHLVVVLEGQDLCAAELRDCVTRFGPLFLYHADEGVLHAAGIPDVFGCAANHD